MRREAPAARGRGETTRQVIVEKAVRIATTEGLEGLSIGRLALSLGMSKSGLFGHFGSKEELQLAVVRAAADSFRREVVDPAADAETGLPRLIALMEAWIDSMERQAPYGGDFFGAAALEFDARPGPVRDEIARLMMSWLRALEDEARRGVEIGQLQPGLDAAQLAFELRALGGEANCAFHLFGDDQAFERARRGAQERLRLARAEASTKPTG